MGCVDVHGFSLYSSPWLLACKGIETGMNCLKDKRFQDTVTVWMISGINCSQVSKYCKVYVLPHISAPLCMSASLYVFLKTDFPCFPIYMTFQNSWIYFSFIERLTELWLESLGLNSKCPTKYSFAHFA